MRIGIVSHMAGLPWGGSEELWGTMAHTALRTGHQVTACLLRPAADHPRIAALQAAGAEILAEPRQGSLARRLTDRIAGLSWRLGDALRRNVSPLTAFARRHHDVVLVNDAVNMPTAEIMEMIARIGKPYVVLSQLNCGEAIGDPVMRRRIADYYIHASRALFVSEQNRSATEFQLLLPQPLANARIVRNPVNLATLDPMPWPDAAPVSFACVGRLFMEDKGQDILLGALGGAAWRSRDWSLSIYGSGPHRAYLADLAAYYGLQDRVRFMGETPDIRQIWERHHALVLASRREGMPLVVVEAMICGRPVISTTAGGTADWVEEGRSGFIGEPTVPSFQAALERAWQARADWPIMGQRARQRALALYDPHPGETLLDILIASARDT